MSPWTTAAVAVAADGASNTIVIRHPTRIVAAVARADVVSDGEMEIQLDSTQVEAIVRVSTEVAVNVETPAANATVVVVVGRNFRESTQAIAERFLNGFSGDVPVTDSGHDADQGNGNEGVEKGLRRWVCGESSGWVLVVMDDVGCDADAVDTNVDMPEAGRAEAGMTTASSNYRSRSRWGCRFDLNI